MHWNECKSSNILRAKQNGKKYLSTTKLDKYLSNQKSTLKAGYGLFTFSALLIGWNSAMSFTYLCVKSRPGQDMFEGPA